VVESTAVEILLESSQNPRPWNTCQRCLERRKSLGEVYEAGLRYWSHLVAADIRGGIYKYTSAVCRSNILHFTLYVVFSICLLVGFIAL
jgi:hypothetical protein